MNSNNKNWVILAGTGLSAGLASVAWLRIAGNTDEQFVMLLKLTARASYMIYLLIFAARPLQQLFTNDSTRLLLRERRSLGVAFAAMHTVHLGLIAWRFSVIPGLEYGTPEAVLGGTAYLLIYLMLITSFDTPARALGSRRWRLLHKTGLYYIGAIFLFTLLPDAGERLLTVERAWFVILTVLALLIRLTAYFARQRKA